MRRGMRVECKNELKHPLVPTPTAVQRLILLLGIVLLGIVFLFRLGRSILSVRT